MQYNILFVGKEKCAMTLRLSILIFFTTNTLFGSLVCLKAAA